MEAIIQFELTKEFLERFQNALDQKDEQFIKQSLDGVNPADITQLLYEFDTEESKYVIDLLEKQVGAQVINDLDEDIRSEFLEAFGSQEIAAFLDFLDSDDCVDILMELSLPVREEVLALIKDEQKASHVQELLHYDEDVAGGLMAKELIKCNMNWTIRQCIEEIRKQAEKVQKIYSVYVVNNTGKLIGKVSLKRSLSQRTAPALQIFTTAM